MPMVPTGEGPRSGDGHDREERLPESHASWRDLASWYPWFTPALGLLLVVAGINLFGELAEQVYEHGAILGLDRRLLEMVAELRTPTVIAAFNVITYLGEGAVVFSAAVIAAVWLGTTTHSWGRPMLLVLTSGGTALTVFLLKLTIARPRPVPAPNAATEDSFAFPSGHSAHSAAVYLMLAILLLGVLRGRWSRAGVVTLGILLMLITGFSRLVLGVHSPSDVVAGWLLGTIFTIGLVSLHTLSLQLAPLRSRLVERAKRSDAERKADPPEGDRRHET
ncbi:undecaprenyl-diphosphatase [Actinopolyspora mzabensis]|uniref:Undecaprenyl-diphosphatase n=1 Tax=Actinopolyspora mzabensis TaxID=995066 RepID=A0A1G9FC94_ACTMZ|nr:phosphatase PAP2 family protein [Actinopolyspora mzabensis]SDK86045.1 undecaprenyl-diphosphatase [Actinopolyspora mzabensis]